MEKIVKYYETKLKNHGSNYKGVDWNSQQSQELRFTKLLELMCNHETFFNILDYGCGYGALLKYLTTNYDNFEYSGYDISGEMIKNAKMIFKGESAKWLTKLDKDKRFDYVIASGLFNVKLTYSEKAWVNYIIKTLDIINNSAIKGFSFNILSSFSDKDRMKSNLFYADPNFYFNHCKIKYSKSVSLLHDYPLHEFTIIVRK